MLGKDIVGSLALSTFGVTKHSKKHAYNILVAIAPVVEHACARCPGQTSVRHMICERMQTESCIGQGACESHRRVSASDE